jgi:PadR family transcriptional regulator PadR
MATPTRLLSRRTVAILQAMLSCADEADALEIAKSARRRPARTYPVLARLEGMSWVDSHWDTSHPGAPRRRLYRLTGYGRETAQHALEARVRIGAPGLAGALRGIR